MSIRRLLLTLLVVTATASASLAFYKLAQPGAEMTEAAAAWLDTLDDEQRGQALLEYDTPKRVDWHFIPKDERKGVQIKHMTEAQRAAAHELLEAALSDSGYDQTVDVMKLEGVIAALEGEDRRWARDPQRYYFTLFGEPTQDAKWGLSVEGHHLSLNFVVEGDHVVASTPQFFGSNPAYFDEIENKKDLDVRKPVLGPEEQIAFRLLGVLDEEQKQQAVIAEEAPKEIRAAGEPQPPQDEAEGIAYSSLNRRQQRILRSLVEEYTSVMAEAVADRREAEIEEAGWDQVHFCWAGASEPGIGHYYRVQGPTFVIELINTQPGADGSPANHVHCVWRDMRGDFAVPIRE